MVDPDRRPGGAKLWLVAVQLGGLWCAAIVQPLLDLLGQNAAFFVARSNTGVDIVVFAIGLALGPPLLLSALVHSTGDATWWRCSASAATGRRWWGTQRED